MPEHNVNILGIDLVFRAEASPEQVEEARGLVEERFEKLAQSGRLFSREKLLTFLALGLADDLIQAEKQAGAMQQQMQGILAEIEEKAKKRFPGILPGVRVMTRCAGLTIIQ